jgi:hypothetical protein
MPNDSSIHETTEQQGASDSNIVHLLERVHDHLLADQYYEHNRLFLATGQATRQDSSFEFIESEKLVNRAPVPGNSAPSPHPETTTSTGTAKANSSPHVNTSNLHPNPQQSEELEYLKTLKQFHEIAAELLDAFLPANYPSKVAGRYYGAMKKIIEASK